MTWEAVVWRNASTAQLATIHTALKLPLSCPCLLIRQLGSDVRIEHVWQQEGQQVLQLLQVVLQRRARQHEPPPAPCRNPGQQGTTPYPLTLALPESVAVMLKERVPMHPFLQTPCLQ